MGVERAVVVRPGEGHRVANVEFLARSADTPRFNFSIITKDPGDGPPLHVHAGEDDAFYILEGEVVMIVEDDEVTVGPGTFVLVPPGVAHTFARLEQHGIRGNGHMMMLEKNSDEIAAFIERWIRENVK